jgi:hypothetical protein
MFLRFAYYATGRAGTTVLHGKLVTSCLISARTLSATAQVGGTKMWEVRLRVKSASIWCFRCAQRPTVRRIRRAAVPGAASYPPLHCLFVAAAFCKQCQCMLKISLHRVGAGQSLIWTATMTISNGKLANFHRLLVFASSRLATE